MNNKTDAPPVLAEVGGGEDEWEAEIMEALEARQQRAEWLARHPRPMPPPALMRRRQAPDHTHARARSITLTMPIDTTAKS